MASRHLLQWADIYLGTQTIFVRIHQSKADSFCKGLTQFRQALPYAVNCAGLVFACLITCLVVCLSSASKRILVKEIQPKAIQVLT